MQLAQIHRATHLTWQLKPSELVSNSPIIQLLRPMLTILSAGPLKLTSKANLPLKLVQAMYCIEQKLPSWQKRELFELCTLTEHGSADEFPYRRSFSVQATKLAEQILVFDSVCERGVVTDMLREVDLGRMLVIWRCRELT